MKIGIISPYALPEKGAVSMRIDSFQKYFLSQKHNVKIFSPKRKNSIEDKNNYRYESIKDLKHQLVEMDYVILTCPSFYTGLKLLPFLKRKKIPFILDLRDLAENNPKKINVLFQLLLVKLAKKITVVTEYMKNYFIKRYKINPKKIIVISNGVDRNIFYPSKNKSKIRKELKIKKESKLIVYEGIIGDHGLEGFIDNLTKKILEKNNLHILLLVIVGETENKSSETLINFQKKLQEKKIEKFVTILKNVKPTKIREYVSASDWGLAPIPSNKNNLYRVPIKAYDYISCNTKILGKGPKGGELEKFILNNNYGIFFNNWEELITNINKLPNIKINHKKEVLDSFDRMNPAKKLLNFILK